MALPKNEDRVEMIRRMNGARNSLFSKARGILHAADGHENLTNAQARDFTESMDQFDVLTAAIAALEGRDATPPANSAEPGTREIGARAADLAAREAKMNELQPAVVGREALGGDVSPSRRASDVVLLTPDQKLADLYRPRTGQRNLSAGRFIRAALTDDWRSAQAELEEFRMMSSGNDVSAGFTLPQALTAGIIDLARARAVMFRAGARTRPYDAPSLVLPKLASVPAAGWRGEGIAAPSGDLTFERFESTPRDLVVTTTVTRNLVDDAPDLGDFIGVALAEELALKLDYAGLMGVGAANEPMGIANYPGVLTTAVNGALTDYSKFSDAVTAIRVANGEPNAFIAAPRTMGVVDKFVDQQDQPLQPPDSYKGLIKLQSNQVPTNLGGGTDTLFFTGDFRRAVLALRMALRIDRSEEANVGDQDAFSQRLVHIRAWLRADWYYEQPTYFHTSTGVTS